MEPGIYTVVIQYSLESLAGGSQAGEIQWYDVTTSKHDGYEERSVGGSSIYGVLSVLVKDAVAETFKCRIRCTSSGSPTTGAAADFFIQIVRLG